MNSIEFSYSTVAEENRDRYLTACKVYDEILKEYAFAEDKTTLRLANYNMRRFTANPKRYAAASYDILSWLPLSFVESITIKEDHQAILEALNNFLLEIDTHIDQSNNAHKVQRIANKIIRDFHRKNSTGFTSFIMETMQINNFYHINEAATIAFTKATIIEFVTAYNNYITHDIPFDENFFKELTRIASETPYDISLRLQ